MASPQRFVAPLTYSETVFAYAPAGSETAGFAIVTERFVALLSGDATADTVSTLHRMLDGAGASAEPALAVLADPRAAERFALVQMIDPVTKLFEVMVRGDVTVDMGGASMSRFSWPRGASWLRGEAHGVESLFLSLDGARTTTHGLPLRNGAVPASAVSVGVDLAINAPLPVVVAAADAGQAPLLEAEEERLEFTVGRTPVAAPAAPAAPVWTLRLPDGNELEAAPQIVVGRRPWRSSPDETQTYYIVAPSPHREISSKHVEFTVVSGELRARDLESTNGTVVSGPHKAPRLLHEGKAVSLESGDVLDLGEGFRIVVGIRA